MKQQKHKILEYEIDISQIHNPQLSKVILERCKRGYLFGWRDERIDPDYKDDYPEHWSEENTSKDSWGQEAQPYTECYPEHWEDKYIPYNASYDDGG